MNKTTSYIQFITAQLKKGTVDFVKVSALFCTKFHKSQRTFATHWKRAQEAYQIEQGEIEKLKSEQYTKTELEAFKSLVLSKQEKQEYLKKIIEGNVTFEQLIMVGGKPTKVQVKANASEVMKALEIDNKMAGDNMPIKSDITILKAGLDLEESFE